MATMRVTVDGNTIMDGDLGQWTSEPPAIAGLKLQAAKKDQPWARHVLLALAEAGVSEQALSVEVKTRRDGWDLSVTRT